MNTENCCTLAKFSGRIRKMPQRHFGKASGKPATNNIKGGHNDKFKRAINFYKNHI